MSSTSGARPEPKPKASKLNGPVDVEKQCGVILPNGQSCARSLTCKGHSMSAKRAVPGRSMPFDMLLAPYQEKLQAPRQQKPQKAVVNASAHREVENDGGQAAVDSHQENDSDFRDQRETILSPL
ncbi:SCA7, zinc-binding domain-containing protein [Chaetomium tenue]|uniref:SCA7, zinc-binding domain-containing protein n=1 Tax=Chaetomium tenue TaxID=1854479 RepID=A0ACB7PEN9_9PEZI|nr:SCA7, zinc-binding domain-containing protein [Chaetomium globosum]